jgi:hypothetical protein
MIQKLKFILIICILIFQDIPSKTSEINEICSFVNNFFTNLDKKNGPIKSLSPYLYLGMQYSEYIDPGVRAKILDLSRTQQSLRYDSTHISHKGNFVIRYSLISSDPIHGVDEADDNYNGVPDFIDWCDSAFEYSFSYEIDSMGYPSPLACYPGNICTVKVSDLRVGLSPVFGFSEPRDACSWAITRIDNDYMGFIKVDNNGDTVINYNNRPRSALRVTAAHEFHHAIQFASNAKYHSLYMHGIYEMCAVWMEDQVYDSINDYIQYFEDWNYGTHVSIEEADGIHEYSNNIFLRYLSERFSPDIIRDLWVDGSAPHPNGKTLLDFYSVLQDVLERYGSSIQEVFSDYALTCFFTGPRADTGIYYMDEAETWPALNIQTVTDLTVSINLDHLSFKLVQIPPALASNLITGTLAEPLYLAISNTSRQGSNIPFYFKTFLKDTVQNRAGETIIWSYRSDTERTDFNLEYTAITDDTLFIMPSTFQSISLHDTLNVLDTISASMNSLPFVTAQVGFKRPQGEHIYYYIYDFAANDLVQIPPVIRNDSVFVILDSSSFIFREKSDYYFGDPGTRVTAFLYDSLSGDMQILETVQDFPYNMILIIAQKSVYSGYPPDPFPNPMRDHPTLTIPVPDEFTFNIDKDFRLFIYTLSGKQVAAMDYIKAVEREGRFYFEWNRKNSKKSAVAPGVYFYIIKSRTLDRSILKKFVILK